MHASIGMSSRLLSTALICIQPAKNAKNSLSKKLQTQSIDDR